MTREEAAKLLPIMKAFSEGKTIQIKPKEGKFWSSSYTDINFSDLSMQATDYRIKPEPKYRPFKNAEECWNEMQKHQPLGWVKCNGQYRLIVRIVKDVLALDMASVCSFRECMTNAIFADGTPFGIKEEECSEI